MASRTVHDLGEPCSGRPVDLVVSYSKHHCPHCDCYFSVDLSDLAWPKCLYTRRVQDLAVRLVAEDGLPYQAASWHLWRDHRVFVPYATIQNWVEAAGKKNAEDASRAATSTRRWLTSPATWPSTRSTTVPSASSRSWTTAGTTAWPSCPRPRPDSRRCPRFPDGVPGATGETRPEACAASPPMVRGFTRRYSRSLWPDVPHQLCVFHTVRTQSRTEAARRRPLRLVPLSTS